MLRPSALLTILLALAGSPAPAAISGRVVDDVSGAPIAGAVVRVKATDGPQVTSNAAGDFTLAVEPTAPVDVAAGVPYQHTAAINYVTNTAFATNGQNNVEIRLRRLPTGSNGSYQPLTASLCGICHEDQYNQWLKSRHAGAAVNPWVLDLYAGTGTPGGSAGYIFKNLHDPGESGFCASCHAPMEDVFTPGQLAFDEISQGWGLEGVGCLGCHQQAHVDASRINGIAHVDGKVSYRFPDDPNYTTGLYVWGNLPDVATGTMRNSYQPQFGDSLICAGCHQYNRPDNGAPGQNTYLEWLASPYAQPGPGFRTCQNCHMPNEASPGPIASTAGFERPASQRHRHDFVGSTPATLAGAITLRTTASEANGRLIVDTEVENQAGHGFPAGVSIRNALLVLDVRADGQPLTQIAGPTVPWYADDEVPGVQPGDFAGQPGKGYAKILEGRINDTGPVVRPVLFIDAEGVTEDTVIPSGQIDDNRFEFLLPPGIAAGTEITVDARLLYRRAFRALAVTKGWTVTPSGGPIEIEVGRQQLTLAASGQSALPVPADSPWTLAALAMALLGLGWAVARRR
jgi:hypothetical protein